MNTTLLSNNPRKGVSMVTNILLRLSMALQAGHALASMIIFFNVAAHSPQDPRPHPRHTVQQVFFVYLAFIVMTPSVIAKNPLFFFYRRVKNWKDLTPDLNPATEKYEAVAPNNFLAVAIFEFSSCVGTFVVGYFMESTVLLALAVPLLIATIITFGLIRRYDKEFLAQFNN